MPNTVPAAATGLPSSRRSLLRGLAALPLAGVPVAAASASTSAVSPDVALIAFAAVERLAARANIAIERCCELESKREDIIPLRTRPTAPAAPVSPLCDMVKTHPDGSFTMRPVPVPLDAAGKLARQQHEAARAAWEAEREAIGRRMGLHVAERLDSRLWDRLQAAAIDLTPMVATTAAGLAAKARVVVEVERFDNGDGDEWIADLRSAVCREAVMIGGAA